MGRFEADAAAISAPAASFDLALGLNVVGRFSNGSVRHKPRTYAEACEELGGQPWRPLEGTEQWFLDEESCPERTLDTAAFRILPRQLIPRTVWLALGAFGIAVAFVMVLAHFAQATPPPVVVAQAPPAVIVVPPPPPAVVAAQPAARPIVQQPPRRSKAVHRRAHRRR